MGSAERSFKPWRYKELHCRAQANPWFRGRRKEADPQPHEQLHPPLKYQSWYHLTKGTGEPEHCRDGPCWCLFQGCLFSPFGGPLCKEKRRWLHRDKGWSKHGICQFDWKGGRIWMTAHVSQCFYKTSIADKHLLGYSNASEHLNHSSGFVKPSRNPLKDSVYSDAVIKRAVLSRQRTRWLWEQVTQPYLQASSLIHVDPCEEGEDSDGNTTVWVFLQSLHTSLLFLHWF